MDTTRAAPTPLARNPRFIPTHNARGSAAPHATNLSPDARSSPISRSFAYRKVTKPLLERRRRARISKSLDELKSLMVDPMKITEESLNRLEKADILEMAVQHLQNLQSRISPNRYQDGFNECAAEACHFLETTSDFDESISERLVEHLETCTGPLTIEVPRFRLTFSPPVSPVSLGSSPQPYLPQTTLQELGAGAPGLLMEAGKVRSSPSSCTKEERLRVLPKKRRFSVGSDKTLSNWRNCEQFGSPLTDCQDGESMWRPW